MNRALFLDRDGVINEDYGYVHRIEDFHLRDGILEACCLAQDHRFLVVVITNQAGIGRGLYSLESYKEVEGYMFDLFASSGIKVSGTYFCPYHPVHGIGHFRFDSYFRKPNPGMILEACKDHNINPLMSIMVGDKLSDAQAASSSGIKLFVNSSQRGWVDNLKHSITLNS